MNWKDPIILGAIAGSGKFKISYNLYEPKHSDEPIEIIYNFRPSRITHQQIKNGGIKSKINMGIAGSVDINNCTLIARPISDMTDEEKESYQDLKTEHFGSGTAIYGPDYTTESPASFLYLLSIGVYSFEDETDVIFNKTDNKA